MKKILIGLVLGVLCICSASAQQLNSTQKKLKTDIFNYLKKEVSNLTDYSATDLKFTLNGTTYFVSISESDYSPMYVTLYAGFNIPDTYKKEVVALAAPTLNSYKGVKFYSGDDYIKLQAEMFMNDYKPFATSFHSLISVMSTIRDSFDEAYEKSKPTYTTSSSFTSAFKRQGNEYIWPYIKTATDKKLYVSKVSLNKDYTVLDMISYNGGEYQWCSIERNSYLLVNGKKYSLQKAENIAYSPSHTDYPNYQSGNNVSLSFKLYFTPIPSNTTEFDFYESASEGWNVKGITLENADIIPVSNSLIETVDHKWEVVSVQCQQHQTIVQKKVLPKVSPSWINSSQEEYIEDSDTGRKYYLIKSDIGFENNRKVLNSKSDVSFYEVFPALPTSVRRINISSGSQYYIKNLSIR
jgi:hypothetical protein